MPRTAKPDTTVRFGVAGTDYEIDAKELTMGEVAEVERHFDKDYDDLHQTQATIAIVYTAMKRANPTTTWVDVESVSINGVTEVKAKRPTRAVPEATGTPAS